MKVRVAAQRAGGPGLRGTTWVYEDRVRRVVVYVYEYARGMRGVGKDVGKPGALEKSRCECSSTCGSAVPVLTLGRPGAWGNQVWGAWGDRENLFALQRRGSGTFVVELPWWINEADKQSSDKTPSGWCFQGTCISLQKD